MGISLTLPAACEPLTLDEALAQCRIDQDIEDGLVAGYLLSAREFAENSTRRTLIKQSFTATWDFLWPMVRAESPASYWSYVYFRTRIELPKTPILSVEAVRYVDVNGAAQTLPVNQYVSVLDGPVPFIEPVFGVVWPPVRYQPNAVSVDFTAGYGATPGTIPETIRQAMLMLIAFWYDNRGSTLFGSRQKAGEDQSSSSVVPTDIPPGVEALLAMHRHYRVLI